MFQVLLRRLSHVVQVDVERIEAEAKPVCQSKTVEEKAQMVTSSPLNYTTRQHPGLNQMLSNSIDSQMNASEQSWHSSESQYPSYGQDFDMFWTDAQILPFQPGDPEDPGAVYPPSGSQFAMDPYLQMNANPTASLPAMSQATSTASHRRHDGGTLC
jgi:hypothetical protein